MPPQASRAEPDPALLGPLWKQFADECGLHGTLRLVVQDTETGQVENYDFEEPFVLIGESAQCQLRLRHPEVSYRHAYLQVVNSRLYCFDLESQTGTFWGPTARRQGPVTLETLLQIGPYTIRVSRAPAMTQCLTDWHNESELRNDPIGDISLCFGNATGRKSGSQLKPVRRCVTLLGRSGRCHVKLSDASVSKIHAGLVRTEHGFWIVDMSGRTPIRLNNDELRFGPMDANDRLTIGRFQMQLHAAIDHRNPLSAAADEPHLDEAAGATIPESGILIRSKRTVAAQRGSAPVSRTSSSTLGPAAALGADPAGGALVTESTLLAVMGHFSQMQQQLMAHAEQQMLTLAQLFSAVHREQQETVLEQLHAIQAITSELRQLRESSISSTVSTTEAKPVAPTIVDGQVFAARSTRRESDTEDVAADVMSHEALQERGLGDPVESASSAESGRPIAEPSNEDELPAESLVRAADTKGSGANRAGQPAGAAAHVWITQRINELERERSGRWTRLMQLVRGGHS